jgi:hypothetical protein
VKNFAVYNEGPHKHGHGWGWERNDGHRHGNGRGWGILRNAVLFVGKAQIYIKYICVPVRRIFVCVLIRFFFVVCFIRETEKRKFF